ncbi:hypothetical protein ALMP_62410 [Streptomyces sp. A012304]|nr:hypothetical protein ALMP_62410 [Streptomyces sp. A012304]
MVTLTGLDALTPVAGEATARLVQQRHFLYRNYSHPWSPASSDGLKVSRLEPDSVHASSCWVRQPSVSRQ